MVPMCSSGVCWQFKCPYKKPFIVVLVNLLSKASNEVCRHNPGIRLSVFDIRQVSGIDSSEKYSEH